jgi:hypothetical protein
MGGTCCHYYQFNPMIPERKAYQIQLALEDMVEIHSEPLPPPYPMTLPHTIQLCICTESTCICPINYTELVHHMLRTIQQRMYAIKGSTGYQHSSAKLAYMIALAQK